MLQVSMVEEPFNTGVGKPSVEDCCFSHSVERGLLQIELISDQDAQDCACACACDDAGAAPAAPLPLPQPHLPQLLPLLRLLTQWSCP